MKMKTEVLRNTTGIRQPKTHLEYKTGFFRGAILFFVLELIFDIFSLFSFC